LLFALYLMRVALSGRGATGAPAAADRALLQTLARDGIVVVPNYLSPAACAAIRAESQGLLQQAESGDASPNRDIRFGHHANERTTRLIGVQAAGPAAAEFSFDARLQAMADAYSSGHAPMFQSFVERKTASN